MVRIRKGQAPPKLDRAAFKARFRQRFEDPAFRAADESIDRVEQIAWEAYDGGRKAPRSSPAGEGYADPGYELSEDWKAARAAIDHARLEHDHPASASRVLVINGSHRNDGTCPGEVSKSFRLATLVCETLLAASVEPDLLDLSILTSEYGRHIHPCKGCVSTAMPLCHWPCSCYPNHSLGQTGDWMNEIYTRWTRAHGIIIVTPVYWYQVPSALKALIDRMVCADGGNPDPTSTQGKDPAAAKKLELAGWPYPKHLAGRAYGVVVHGDVAGIEGVRRSLSDWLAWTGHVDAGFSAHLDRYIGYYEPYATSHRALDRDEAVQEEVRNVARAVARCVAGLRAGVPLQSDEGLVSPRPK